MTTFFEPISVSAPHIYHSALELSPLSSIVRKFYHHQHLTPFPRVATGIPDSWGSSTAISSMAYSDKSFITWSPCGQFIATQTEVKVEVRDALTFGLSATLQPTGPTCQLTGPLAYSPDGRSLACSSDAAIVIWDTQTGGVVKEIQHDNASGHSLVWSLDGASISTMDCVWMGMHDLTVCVYDVASGTALPPITLQSNDEPHLWAHRETLRLMTTAQRGKTRTIDIFDVWPAPTRIESFPIQLESFYRIKTFSPAAYRISILYSSDFRILDIRNSEALLIQNKPFESLCFSSDGSLFAASKGGSVHIWKCESSHYIPWGEFPSPAGPNSHYLFSPTSPSILGHSHDTLRLWRLDGVIIAPTTYSEQLGVFSDSGTYMATARKGGHTITITNHLSQTPSQFIDTDIEIFELGLTGNVLLVMALEEVMGWLLTGEGLVDGVFRNRRAGRGDSIWTMPTSQFRAGDATFLVEGEYAAIRSHGCPTHIYDTRTGKARGFVQEPLHSSKSWYRLPNLRQARKHLCGGFAQDAQNAPPEDGWRPSRVALKEGWVKDREGKHLLWLPIEWRVEEWHEVQWFSDIATMLFLFQGEPIAIKLCKMDFWQSSPNSDVASDP